MTLFYFSFLRCAIHSEKCPDHQVSHNQIKKSNIAGTPEAPWPPPQASSSHSHLKGNQSLKTLNLYI